MKDQVSITRVRSNHPKTIESAMRAIDAAEAKLGPFASVRIVQAFRTFEVQDGLFEIGRTVKGSNARPGHFMGDIVTKARGGRSPHNYGLANDFCILYDKDQNGTFESVSWDLVKDLNRDGQADWKTVVDAFIAEGWGWGGNWHSWKDNPHVEMLFGYESDCMRLLQKYNKKEFIPGTTWLEL